MSRHFTIPTMLRMTPNLLLQQFFQRLGVRLYSIDWKRLGERQIKPLQHALSWTTAEEQARVETALSGIFELACEEGWRAILDAARDQGDAAIAKHLAEDACYYERAMWTWLNQPEIFSQASALQEISSLTRWRRRTGLPVLVPRITPASIRELGSALSQCLRREEGRGKNCTVEYYRRGNGTDIFAAYPDDFVQTVTTHDEAGTLVTRPLRQTFEIVFALRADEGVLELYAQVASAIKPKLECVFGQIILGADLSPQPYSRPFDLNRLKDRYFCLDTDPADRVSAAISRLRLAVPNCGWLTVEPKGEQLAIDEAFFWELLVYLCEPQASERKISAEQFGALMASDCLFEARRLFFDAWLDFFQKLRRQDKAAVVQKVAAYLAKAMELTVAKLTSPEMTEIDKLVESRMQSSLNESFGQLRDSLAASTPGLSPGGN